MSERTNTSDALQYINLLECELSVLEHPDSKLAFFALDLDSKPRRIEIPAEYVDLAGVCESLQERIAIVRRGLEKRGWRMNDKLKELAAKAYAVSIEANEGLLAIEELTDVMTAGERGDKAYIRVADLSEFAQLEILAAVLGEGAPVTEDTIVLASVYSDGNVDLGNGKPHLLPDWWQWILTDERGRAAEAVDACRDQLREISHEILLELAGPDATYCDQCGRLVSAEENEMEVDVDGASDQLCWWCRKEAADIERRARRSAEPPTEVQCARCLRVVPVEDTVKRSAEDGYHDICSQCEARTKAYSDGYDCGYRVGLADGREEREDAVHNASGGALYTRLTTASGGCDGCER